MAFIWKKSLVYGAEILEEVTLAAVSVTKGSVLYGASGYATNATVGNALASNIIGVVQNTVDNSGGAAGDKSALICVDPTAVYLGNSTGTIAVSMQWTNVTLDSVLIFDEDDPITVGGTADTALVKIRKMVSTSQAYISLNFGPVGDA